MAREKATQTEGENNHQSLHGAGNSSVPTNQSGMIPNDYIGLGIGPDLGTQIRNLIIHDSIGLVLVVG